MLACSFRYKNGLARTDSVLAYGKRDVGTGRTDKGMDKVKT